MLWTRDVVLLMSPILIPTDYMSIDDKLNCISRLVLLVGIIASLIMRDSRLFLLTIILLLIIPVIHSYQSSKQEVADNFLNSKSLDVIDNTMCVRPTQNNPFMNPSFLDIGDKDTLEAYNAHGGSCPIGDKDISQRVDKILNSNVFRNADDIYDRENSKRQFYTVPGGKIPNNQKQFANWLYGSGKTCKENNGEQCYHNLYKDLRT